MDTAHSGMTAELFKDVIGRFAQPNDQPARPAWVQHA